MTGQAREIAKMIAGMAGRYSPHEIFADWVRCSALTIANTANMFHDAIWQTREREYIQTMQRYQLEERQKFSKMFFLLGESFEAEMDDALGEIYMSSEMGSRIGGQFFTPFHLSELTAKLGFDAAAMEDPDYIEELNEPSCGSGGMVIAAAKAMKELGINYQKRMKVVAQDLDWRCVHMCYVQLSLLGIKGIVVQGNTLAEPYVPGTTDRSHILTTPAAMGMLV